MDLPDPAPGTLERGWLDVAGLPTGGAERLPVIVVEGGSPGPTAWVTAGVHGDEVTGVAAAQDVARAFAPADGGADASGPLVEPADLRGRLVCVPVVNPAGLRRTTRHSYYAGEDPNRTFPDPTADSVGEQSVQERIAERLYDAFADADLLLDLHTAQVNSIAYVIRHRVLYGERRDRETAEELADDLGRLTDALDLPTVVQYTPEEYVERGLHRSVAGAALNGAGVPACTVELGSHSTVDDRTRAAGVADVFRALVAFDALDSVPDPVLESDPSTPDPVDFQVRRYRGPRVDAAGVVRPRVDSGDTVEAGDVVADVRAANGEYQGSVTSDHDGYVLAYRTGVAVYENDSVAALAVRDEEPLVGERP